MKSIAASLLENVPGYGVIPIVVGAAITLAVAVCAAYFPARRAARVDPLVAFRSE